MAEQEGILPYTGKLGDTVGYRKNKKFYKRAKPASYQPASESQKAGAEFGTGSKAVALLKVAFGSLILRSFKATLHNRLAVVFRKIIRSGTSAKKGERGVFDGNLQLLKGFELNPKAQFIKLCNLAIDSQITAKQINIKIPAFDWQNKIKAPKNAQRMKVGLCCVFADFKNGTTESVNANQLNIKENRSFPGASLRVDIPAKEEMAVFLIANLFFETDSLNKATIIENQNYQAGIILDVAHIKDGALVEFVAEKPIEKLEEEAIKVDVFWQVEGDDV
nr:hypothetical protein [uncultured Pedobacter sp.]